MVMFIIICFGDLPQEISTHNHPHGILETTSPLGILNRRMINYVNIKT